MSLNKMVILDGWAYKIALLISCMSISISIWANCSINSSSLIFGAYDVFAAYPTDSVGNIHVQCDEESAYTLKISQGNGSYANRYMVNQKNQLNYNLYMDASYLLVWGDGTDGSSTQSAMTAHSVQYNIYGRIFARQNVSVGYYSDVILVTLEY